MQGKFRNKVADLNEISAHLIGIGSSDSKAKAMIDHILNKENLDEGQLAMAASCYNMADVYRKMQPEGEEPSFWPFDPALWIPFPEDRMMELAIAQVFTALEAIRLTGLSTDKEE